ncbi:MAG TPA: hypothetical protein EYN67_06685 [Flavobacteriales bacterium]|nr:hypothetical protein [Flavobacteriales bacterium]
MAIQLSTFQIKNNAVTQALIASNAVGSAELADDAVVADAIATGAVTSTKLANGAVVAAGIANNAVGTLAINNLAVTGGKIANLTITATQIANNTITSTQLANKTVTAGQIADNTVTSAQIAATTITATELATGAVTSTKLGAGAVIAASIASSAVGTDAINNLAVTSAKIANLTITAGQIANTTITDTQIANTTITAAKIANATITATQIANTTITAAKIVNATITNVQLATGAVTSTQIAAGAVLAAGIGTGAVGTSELAANCVTGGELADNCVTADRISGSAVTAGKIATAAITSGNLNISGQNWDLSGATYLRSPTPSASPNDNDVATVGYVASLLTGVHWKDSVKCATAAVLPANTYANGASGVGATITANASGTLTIDAVTAFVAGTTRVLIKNETAGNALRNGIYVVTNAGAVGAAFILTRATDFDTSAKIIGGAVFVREGTAGADQGFISTNDSTVTVGTTAMGFSQFTGGSSLADGSVSTAKLANNAVTYVKMGIKRKQEATVGNANLAYALLTDTVDVNSVMAFVNGVFCKLVASGPVDSSEYTVASSLGTTTVTFGGSGGDLNTEVLLFVYDIVKT